MPDQTPIPDPFDDDDDEPGYCEACCNTGEVDSVFDGSPMPCLYCRATEPDPDRLREDRDERVRLAKEIPDDE